MFENYKIIVDSGKTKNKTFYLFDIKEAFMILGTAFGVYFLLSKFMEGILPFVIGLSLAFIVGFMYIEMPNHMTIWQHLKLVWHYFAKMPVVYYYYLAKKKQEVQKVVQKQKKTKQVEDKDKGFAH